MTGISSAQMVGSDKHWEAFYTEKRPTLADLMLDGRYDLLSGYYSNYSKSILTPDGWHAEGWYINLGGRDRYILFESTPIRNDRGKIIAAVENIQDITALKLADEEMMRMRSYLKNIIDSMPSILLGVDPGGGSPTGTWRRNGPPGYLNMKPGGSCLEILCRNLRPSSRTYAWPSNAVNRVKWKG